MLPGGGCWGLSNIVKAGGILGKGQQLCRITEHFSWQQNSAANCFTDNEAERKDYFLCPLPALAKTRGVQLDVKSQLVWYHAR